MGNSNLHPRSLEKVKCNLRLGGRFYWTRQDDLLWLLDTGKACREVMYTLMVATMIWIVLNMIMILKLSLQELIHWILDVGQNWNGPRDLYEGFVGLLTLVQETLDLRSQTVSSHTLDFGECS